MNVLDRMQERVQAFPLVRPTQITTAQVLLAGVLILAVFTRFWRLDTPGEMYFDEVYFPKTAQEIARGDSAAWEFYGHENTHPPLSKLFMAGGMKIIGALDSIAPPLVPGVGGIDNPFAWRFFGALAGVGSVLLIYLLAKKLFESEVAGLAAAFMLTADGLMFAQARIATPDTYVLFFVLGSVYFLVSDRFLFSGAFFGAAVACKWVAIFTIVPIILYVAWRFAERFKETMPDERMRPYEWTLLAGLALLVLGGVRLAASVEDTVMSVFDFGAGAISLGSILGGDGRLASNAIVLGVAPVVVGLALLIGALAAILANGYLRSTGRARLYLQVSLIFPVFFLMIPFYVYALTYIPMLLNHHSISDAWELNRAAYNFHSTLEATHPYQAPWDTWPVMARPLYLYVVGHAKIYSMGNPILFWLTLPALAFVLWQGLRFVRANVDAATGDISLAGSIRTGQLPLLFVVLAYLGFWLPWATQPRVMFLYHYMPALSFAILALAYVVHWLWQREEAWGRTVSVGILAAVGLTFAYFYPHLSALDVPGWLDQSYYWFKGPGLFNWS